nr:hypothetical protein [Tanacetum cinerariifolium]
MVPRVQLAAKADEVKANRCG